MALFKRRVKTGETNELRVEINSWAKRVGRVGVALDSLRDDVRDVVVVTEGDEHERGEVVSLLGYRQSTYVAGWTSLMYRLNQDDAEPVFVNERGLPAETRVTTSTLWQGRFHGVGLLMDEIDGKLLSPSIVVLPSGVVVNSLVTSNEWPPQYALRSFAYSNDQITGAVARERAAIDATLHNGVRSS